MISFNLAADKQPAFIDAANRHPVLMVGVLVALIVVALALALSKES